MAPPAFDSEGRRVDTAVWSFWSEPYRSHYRSRWLNDRDHLMSWALSWSTVSRFFGRTALVTDSPGARLLVDTVGLDFDSVVTSLDDLVPAKRDWWTLGKLRAYSCQAEPFLHFDSDVFLWKSPAEALRTAAVTAQNPEDAPLDDSSYYRPTLVTEAFRRFDGRLPSDLLDYVRDGGCVAACTGIFGGCAWEDIAEYARIAERLILSGENARAWAQVNDPFRCSVFAEQFYLAAWSKARERSKRPGVRYLFASQADSFDAAVAEREGYTHLISDAKRIPRLVGLMRRELQRESPSLYDSCARVHAREPAALATRRH
jgi:hypothetical protein